MLAVRRHLLPGEDDSDISIARALWLHKQQREDLQNLIATAVAKAFGGTK